MHDRPSDHAMSKVDARVDSSDDDRLTLIQEINRLSSNEVFMEPGQEDSDPKNVSPVPIVMALAKRKKRYRKMANANDTRSGIDSSSNVQGHGSWSTSRIIFKKTSTSS